MINYWKVINNLCVSMHKLKHFQPHSLLCHLWCMILYHSFSCDIFYMMIWIVVEAASTNYFFFIIYNFFHIASQLSRDSCTSRTITSSQYHPRASWSLLGQPNLYKNCYMGFAQYEFASYIERNATIYLLILFFSFSYFFFLSFNFILHMKLKQSICWYFFLIQLFLFFFPSTSYIIWSWSNLFAGSFFSFS